MISLPQVTVTAKIYESANSLVYRGIREADRIPVILKVLKEDYPTPAELTRYKQEYEITRSLNLDGVVKAYDLQDYQRSLVMLCLLWNNVKDVIEVSDTSYLVFDDTVLDKR
jgi:serine/threonine protein kinase